jgi:hypothetical protein
MKFLDMALTQPLCMMAWRGQTMKVICSIALALAVLIQPTGSRADFALAGVGAISCGKLSQDYQRNPTQTENMMMTWAQGFMSGENISLPPGNYRD